eukprot:Hpha_TRINITY_DN15249_c3_g2::TRINITY_DN15249_c3_g2_i2::g.64997::m.64997
MRKLRAGSCGETADNIARGVCESGNCTSTLSSSPSCSSASPARSDRNNRHGSVGATDSKAPSADLVNCEHRPPVPCGSDGDGDLLLRDLSHSSKGNSSVGTLARARMLPAPFAGTPATNSRAGTFCSEEHATPDRYAKSLTMAGPPDSGTEATPSPGIGDHGLEAGEEGAGATTSACANPSPEFIFRACEIASSFSSSQSSRFSAAPAPRRSTRSKRSTHSPSSIRPLSSTSSSANSTFAPSFSPWSRSSSSDFDILPLFPHAFRLNLSTCLNNIFARGTTWSLSSWRHVIDIERKAGPSATTSSGANPTKDVLFCPRAWAIASSCSSSHSSSFFAAPDPRR